MEPMPCDNMQTDSNEVSESGGTLLTDCGMPMGASSASTSSYGVGSSGAFSETSLLSSFGVKTSLGLNLPSCPGGFDFGQGYAQAEKRKEKPPKSERFCLVCGSKAQGYNFNAITCESCKAFFRRNAYKFQALTCMFQGNCIIEIRTRRFCPYCRLKKCFDVGMKKEMILDENERKARMQKMSVNKYKKKTSSLQCTELPTYMIKEEPHSPNEDVSSTNEHLIRKKENFVDADAPGAALYNGEQFQKANPDNVFNSASNDTPTNPELYRVLSEEEKNLISEIAVSYESIMASYVLEKEEENYEKSYRNMNQMVNQCESAVIRLIKFVKTVQDFKQLTKEDQIATLKTCVVSSILLRSVTFYDEISDGFRTPTGVIRSSVLKQATGHANYHDAHIAFCCCLKKLIRDDITVIALIQMLIVFSPEAEGITNRVHLSHLQEKYMLLLKHHLEATFSYMHGQKVLASVLQKITELQVVGEKHAQMLLQVDPKQIEPLLLEVLNLH